MPYLKISSSLTFFYLIPSCPDHDNPYLDPQKPTLLLLHPRLFDSYFFTPQWRDARLARGYNLLAIDHHYHGKTKVTMDDKPYDFDLIAKDLLKALDKLGVDKCHIFGNSCTFLISVSPSLFSEFAFHLSHGGGSRADRAL
jgi:pimeloyl-ACP methyl ester carboxylesterase